MVCQSIGNAVGAVFHTFEKGCGNLFYAYSRLPLTVIGTSGSILLMTQSLIQCNLNRGPWDEWGCAVSTHPLPNAIMCTFTLLGVLEKALRLENKKFPKQKIIIHIKGPGKPGALNQIPVQVQAKH